MKKFTLVAALLAVFTISTSAQDVDKARALLKQALAALEPTPTATIIATAEQFDTLYEAAQPGDILQLAPTFTYTSPLTLRKSITIRGPEVPEARMTKELSLPSFKAGIIITGDDINLTGVEVRQTTPIDILRLQGARNVVDRSRVLGDPEKGAKRCIAANGKGGVKVTRNYVDDCFLPSPGQDSQALSSWEMDPGLLVEDNYLSGGSETLLFGGADSSSDAKTPADIVLRGNTITKNPAWMGKAIGVKNLIEFKNAKRVLVENNTGSYSWVQGQTGYLVVLTVRNQDGRAPWSTIQDVIFRNNTWTDGASAITILGHDDIKEMYNNRDVPIGTVRRSVPMHNVVIMNDKFTIDPVKYKGGTNTKAILINQGPENFTIDHVTITSLSQVGSAVYFAGSFPTSLTFTNNGVPASRYGMFGDSAGPVAVNNWTETNPTWIKYAEPTGTMQDITVIPIVVP